MSAVLRVENVDKAFGGIVVADKVNIEIARGEILGLIGPNGAGKTSLFNLISGVIKPDAGHIYLNGDAHRSTAAVPPGAQRHRPHVAEHAAVHDHDGPREPADRAALLSGRVDLQADLSARTACAKPRRRRDHAPCDPRARRSCRRGDTPW